MVLEIERPQKLKHSKFERLKCILYAKQVEKIAIEGRGDFDNRYDL